MKDNDADIERLKTTSFIQFIQIIIIFACIGFTIGSHFNQKEKIFQLRKDVLKLENELLKIQLEQYEQEN